MKLRFFALLLALTSILSLSLVSCSEDSLDASDGWYPAGYQLASNSNLDYTMFVPDTWTVDISTGILTASTTGGNVSMIATSVESGTTLDSFWKTYETQFDPAFVDFTYITEGESMLLSSGKVAAKKYVYSATVTGNEYQFMQVVALVGETAYIFTFTALAANYDSLVESVDGILNYLSFDAASSSKADTAEESNAK